ncbi:MAG: DUF1801 domain-containing protein [OCS116 cluster bacterium]|uniref:YdhG-like domain-containing protein n=1 Tax=OCS116 cluster bacterium TaxID=2030921 RepID=A0A2A4YYL3_9PROT|nr:DUF1801 domain-containing protein [OCS116 cluster bacterium]
MTNNQNKTSENDADVDEFIASVEKDVKRADTQKIMHMMQDISGYVPKMFGTSIIGFGSYHYVYDSGREGDSMKIGFAPRKANIVLYIMPGFEAYQDKLAKLGKHKTGKSCLYINKLADIDEGVLREIIKISIDVMNEKYG